MCSSGVSGPTVNAATISSSDSARQATPRAGSSDAGAQSASSAARPAPERRVSSFSACSSLSPGRTRMSMNPVSPSNWSWTRRSRNRRGPAVASHENERPSPSQTESKLSHAPTRIRPGSRSRIPRLNGSPSASA